jgi:hypothetical protein
MVHLLFETVSLSGAFAKTTALAVACLWPDLGARIHHRRKVQFCQFVSKLSVGNMFALLWRLKNNRKEKQYEPQ